MFIHRKDEQVANKKELEMWVDAHGDDRPGI